MEPISCEAEGHVFTLTLRRPPHNFVDRDVLRLLADELARLDALPACRAVVLASEGRVFCGGVDFSGTAGVDKPVDPSDVYLEAMRLFRMRKPIVAAVQGAAVGAGLGLALVADFRVASSDARFSASFTRLGFHPGFGLSVTLPRLVGEQQAALLFYTGRRIDAQEALRIGLADQVVAGPLLRESAVALAQEIAISSPPAVRTIRETLRTGLADRIEAANRRECELQRVQFASADFKEGVAAMAARRPPAFTSD